MVYVSGPVSPIRCTLIVPAVNGIIRNALLSSGTKVYFDNTTSSAGVPTSKARENRCYALKTLVICYAYFSRIYNYFNLNLQMIKIRNLQNRGYSIL